MARRLCGAEHYPEPLLAVAGYGLPGAAGTFPARPLTDQAWAELVAAARGNRVVGALMAAVERGLLPATQPQAALARQVHRANLLRMLNLERELLTVLSLLDAAGVDSRVLKGTAVAHLDYPDPALRSFIDLDVLVRAEDIDTAAARLAASGFTRTLAEPRPGFDRRFDKGMTLIPAAGYELDLHRTFVLGPWGVLMKPEQLWDDHEVFHIGGTPVRALSRRYRFLHACFHAALGDWPLRLGSLRDVAEMLPKLNGDGAAVRDAAADWGAEAVVAAAVADSIRLLGLRPEVELARWATAYRPSRREEGWLDLYNRENKTFAAQALATLRVLRWRDKLDYVRALAVPDPRYTAERHSSPLARFRYAVREVRQGRGVPC